MSKKQDSTQATVARRAVLGAVATGGSLAVVASVSGLHLQAEAPAQLAAKAPADPAGGYQLTDHVKQYYSTARI